jgi:hypothetical protein
VVNRYRYCELNYHLSRLPGRYRTRCARSRPCRESDSAGLSRASNVRARYRIPSTACRLTPASSTQLYQLSYPTPQFQANG